MFKFNKIVIQLILLFLFASTNFAQSEHFNKSVYVIDNYLTSSQFYRIRITEGELAAIDSLYAFALKYFDEDVSETLLSLTFALLPFDKIEIINGLNLQLPTVDSLLFVKRNESLPSNFLPDSPMNKRSDTDKLSHFFGNAFVSYNLNFSNIQEFLGLFVEAFEYNFKVNGAFDKRDLEVNRYGKLFGILLKSGKKYFPSDIFVLYSLKFMELP